MPRRITKHALRASVVLSTLLLAAGISGCGKTESSATLLADAKQYQQKGDNKAALIQLKNAASKSPEDAEVRFELARTYIDTGDSMSAEKEIRKAISLGYDRVRAAPLLAMALLMQGQPQKAIDATNEDLAKASPELLTSRGDAYTALNDTAKASEAYQKALSAKPGAPAPLVGLARLAIGSNDSAGANRYLEQALAANPKDPGVWMFKAAMLRGSNKLDEAQAAYGQVLAFKPDHGGALLDRAQLRAEAGQFDAAQSDIAAARKVAPGSLMVAYTQAVLDFRQGKFAAAKESVQQVTRRAPDYMPAVLLSAAVDLNLGAHAQAEQSLNRYLEKYPDNGYARKLLAQTLLKSARPAEATAALEPMLKDGANDGQLMALAGMSAAQSKDFDKASDYFQKASVIDPKSVSVRTSLGLSKMSGGDTEAGIAELEQAAALNPKSEPAAVALVRAHVSVKQFDKALAAAARVEPNHPNSAALHNLKGGAYLGKGDTANARTSFDKAASLQASDFSPVMNLAQLDMNQKNPDAAKKRIESFLAKNKNHVEATFALADIATVQGRKDDATALLEKAAADNPNAAAPALRLGAHYLANKQPQKALTLARKAKSLQPTNLELSDLLGQAQIANEDLGGALDTYSTLVKLAPKSAAAQMRMARVHVLQKNYAAATDDLKRAVALEPGYMPARLAQVELAARTGKMDDALGMARQMQSQMPKSAAGYVVEGDLQTKLERPALALAAYEKALTLSKSQSILLKVVDSMKRMGKSKEAELRVTQWLKANPSDGVAQLYLAELHMANKQFKPAAELLQGLLKRQPDSVIVLNNLAWTWQQDKDPRALGMAERAAKLAPENPAVLDTLGWILVEQGDVKRALPLLQKALSLAPAAPEIRYHQAAALSKSGDKAGARKELEKLLAEKKPFAQQDEARALLKLL
jgi:putative PEP-CTERM system TPR-repeat lipoprotein